MDEEAKKSSRNLVIGMGVVVLILFALMLWRPWVEISPQQEFVDSCGEACNRAAYVNVTAEDPHLWVCRCTQAVDHNVGDFPPINLEMVS